jgi:hypothetical protein
MTHERIQKMTKSVRRHPGASLFLNMAGAAEESFYWIDEATGLLCKCRPDYRIPERRILVDLKSCEDASPEAFARTIFNYTYYIQAGFYLDGVSQVLAEPYRTFIFIAVEKTPPYPWPSTSSILTTSTRVSGKRPTFSGSIRMVQREQSMAWDTLDEIHNNQNAQLGTKKRS